MATFTVTAHSSGTWGTDTNPVVPRPSETYLGMSKEFLRGAQVLNSSDSTCAVSIGLLVAQGLENALKAWLCRDGKRRDVRSFDVGHDLSVLWDLAAKEGLTLPEPKPSWLLVLARNHARPFHDRYSEDSPIVVNPNSEQSCSGLETLIALVCQQLNQVKSSQDSRDDA
jgi:hypothetical protein